MWSLMQNWPHTQRQLWGYSVIKQPYAIKQRRFICHGIPTS
jgi:hypothetical protein